MKITITVPDYIYEKLEGDRGMIPRSTWIQQLIATSIRAPKDMEKMYGVSVVDVIEKKADGELEVERTDTYKAEVPGLDPEDEYEIRERVVVKPGKKLDRLVKDGVVRKGVKELPSQDVGGLKTYFKEKKK